MLKIIECPRDAMQGIHSFIPTKSKINYINSLLRVGFDTLDFGSFVSLKAIPQMADTKEVLAGLDNGLSKTKLLAIIANIRGAEEASQHTRITYLGYPFSISETFQQRNTNRGIKEAYEDLKKIQGICLKKDKELIVYISMGFGNPYGDSWNPEIVHEWVEKINRLGVKIFSLADTVGEADVDDITNLFKYLIVLYPHLEFGAHFHSRPEVQLEKIKAAYDAGCRRFDSAILGFGGCPMAKDDLVGNTATEVMLDYFNNLGIDTKLNSEAFLEAKQKASVLFNQYQ
jgi:hydroxymethylglutaryl-CoA lyase